MLGTRPKRMHLLIRVMVGDGGFEGKTDYGCISTSVGSACQDRRVCISGQFASAKR
jgi:hypothetical protein